MKFWKKDDVDSERKYKEAQKGYGVAHPEKIQGFNAFYGFTFGEIYVDEAASEMLQSEKGFEEVIDACLLQFRKFDYGRKASKDEEELNFENRLFFGLNCGLVGRYDTRYGTLEIAIPDIGRTQITLCPCSIDERKANTSKRLFSANVVKIAGENAYRLEPIGEKVMGEVWDGDVEKLLRKQHEHDKRPADTTFHKRFPYNAPLDRNGIFGDDELFVEFDDGDLCGITFYYSKEVE